ncbi:hypothetical protein H4219_003372 [Mycoemilia scoparia]|uniref:ATP synthase-coupling factor 6, mitochondrial n=1 Tax=Mycoemilia scoparia TaxID=417184 RepID=A0A9W8A4E8_9FUNG|nr:hypothetical protein H4219_003372 [Mycoemilia scoparia]
MLFSAVRMQAARATRNLTSSSVNKDFLRDLYVKEIRSYKPEASANKSDIAVPKTEADLATQLEKYAKGDVVA